MNLSANNKEKLTHNHPKCQNKLLHNNATECMSTESQGDTM